MMAHQKAEFVMFALFVGRLLTLGNYYILYFSVTLPAVRCSDISRDDVGHDDAPALEPDEDDSDDHHLHRGRIYPNRNKKRVLTNTKLFYFLQNPRQMLTSESQRSQDQLTAKNDYDYNGYYPTQQESPNSYKAIHIHSASQPMQYHGKSKDDHFWPLLLLSFLPILFGSLILLPLLISFFTQILQLLAMMQNTITNMNTTTQSPQNLMGRRRRRHISKLEVDYYPNGSDEMVELFTRRLSRALLRFDAFKSSS